MGKYEFINDLKDKCYKNNIKLTLKPIKQIKIGKNIYGGWFDDVKLELVCAYRPWSRNQLGILVHESCHLDQHILQTKIWRDANRRDKNGECAWDKWGKLLTGTQYPIRFARTFMRKIQLVEMECEKMALAKIKKYDLEINHERYIAGANAYILFYTLVLDTKKWIDYKGPYKFPSIMNQMRKDKIISKFDMSDELKELYKSKIYKKA